MNYSIGVQEMDGSYTHIAVGSIVTGIASLALGWFLGTFKKISKKEHAEDLAEIRREIEKNEVELKQFARQAALDEIKGDMRRLETKIDSKLDSIQQQLLTLIARDHK